MAKPRAVVTPGERFRYVITLRNSRRNSTQNNVVISDNLPSQINPINAINGEIVNQSVTWVVPTLLPNAERSFGLEVQCPQTQLLGDN